MPGHASLLQTQTFAAAAAYTATGDSGAIDLADWDILTAQVAVTAVSGTNPSMNVYIQTTYDFAVTWVDIAVCAAAITATGVHIVSVNPSGTGATAALYSFAATTDTMAPGSIPKACALGSSVRVRWVLTGTNPSFTMSIIGVKRRLA